MTSRLWGAGSFVLKGYVNDAGDVSKLRNDPNRFPINKKVKLNYFDTEVDVQECLEWFTAKADLRAVRNSALVSPHFDLLVKMAENEANVYDKST